MKRLLVLLSFVFVVGLPVAAAGAHGPPEIHEKEALYNAGRYLKEPGSGWNRRDQGSIDCDGGRINAYAWQCRAKWRTGHLCRRMRIRVKSQLSEDGVPYYRVLGTEVRHRC
jgi:hypothetical protein